MPLAHRRRRSPGARRWGPYARMGAEADAREVIDHLAGHLAARGGS
ncbi:hypothetical protein [Nonomuraea deserti]|nr:hypothetical protein [Nonomuraea deserti]